MIYGIDINALTKPSRTGTERYVFSLLTHMMKQPLEAGESVKLYAAFPIKDLPDLPQGWSLEIVKWPLGKGWTHGGLSWELKRRTPNVFFTPAHEIPRFHGRTQIVTTIHDVAFRRYPNLYSWKSRRRQEWAVGSAVKKANQIITVSRTTKQDLIELYRADESKITAIPLAIDPARFAIDQHRIDEALQRYRLGSKRYFFFVGRLEAKKNITTLLHAFETYKRDRGIGDPIELVLGGTFGEGADAIKKTLSGMKFRKAVRLLGYVPEEDLAPLMKGALAYTFSTWYEGFGIPALEAFAATVPLVASDVPALREVAEGAALYASPKHAAAWTDAMKKIALRKVDTDQMIENGTQRLAHFSWDKAAQKTWEVLRSV